MILGQNRRSRGQADGWKGALRALQIQESPDGSLEPWIEASKAKKGLSYQLEQKYLTRFTIAAPMQVSTDDAGKFRLTGLGRNRLVRLRLDGPFSRVKPTSCAS